jgi:ATP-dependent exoDNAse (exonuclease V) beta subunit/CRISPR/Cas system-associated exonuclease Cas4 (RecB family)
MPLLVYKSSAGSGKTTTLVNEYLNLIFRSKDRNYFRTILAITFTNKAAAEMKERIIKTLAQLADAKGDLLKLNAGTQTWAAKFCHEEATDFPALSIKAEDLLRNILHRYSDLAISTIDKFVHRLIRTFAFDLKLPGNFVVEMDADEIINTAIDALMQKVGDKNDEAGHQELTLFLTRFILSKLEDEKGWNIESDLLSLSKELMKETSISYIKQLNNWTLSDFSKLREELVKDRQTKEEEILTLANELLKLMDDNGLGIDDFSGKSRGGFYSNVSRLTEGELPYAGKFQKILNNESFYPKTAPSHIRSVIDSLDDELRSLAFRIDELYSVYNSHHYIIKSLIKYIYQIGLLESIYREIEIRKNRDGKVPISEFNKIISDVIKNEQAPFIYERIGEKYQHYFIDEFQDTSVLQWQNLLPLLENSLSEGHTNLVVGDAKQSIYRWRGGEMEQFVQLPALYRAEPTPENQLREALIRDHYNGKVLDTNYRSGENIINFNNSLFDFLKSKMHPETAEIYKDVSQKSAPGKKGGSVTVFEVDEEIAENTIEDEILNYVNRFKKENGYDYKDMAVICRANRQCVSIATHLLSNGVKIISDESLRINSSQDVMALVNALMLLDNIDNDAAKLDLMQYLFTKSQAKNSALDYSEYFKPNHLELHELMTALDIDFQESSLINLPLTSLVSELAERFGLNIRENVFLQFFMEKVSAFAADNYSSLAGFNEWWAEKGGNFNIAIPQGVDAVQVMTIHKAKGLQFPVVLFPYANLSDTVNHQNRVWVELEQDEAMGMPVAVVNLQKDLENGPHEEVFKEEVWKTQADAFNMFYVAVTRPEDHLVIMLHKSARSNNFYKWITEFMAKNNKGKYVGEDITFGDIQQAKKQKAKEETQQYSFANYPLNSVAYLEHHVSDISTTFNEESRSAGIGFHEAVAKVKTKNDLIELATQAVGETKNQLEFLINNPELDVLWAPDSTILAERTFINTQAEIIRPDRIAIHGDSAVVADYKTGLKEKEHALQLEQYMQLLNDLGYQNVKGYLVYAALGEIESF